MLKLGYGLPAFGGSFIATANLSVAHSDGEKREYCLGWRLTSAVRGDPGFEVSLDGTRKEAANDKPRARRDAQGHGALASW